MLKMYDSELMQKGYKISYELSPNNVCEVPYFGVDTQEKLILLFNVKKDDISNIEKLLHSADLQYKGLIEIDN